MSNELADEQTEKEARVFGPNVGWAEEEIDRSFHEDNTTGPGQKIWLRNLRRIDHGIRSLEMELEALQKTLYPLLVPDREHEPGRPGRDERIEETNANGENGPGSKLFKFIDQALADRVLQITKINYAIRELRRRIEL